MSAVAFNWMPAVVEDPAFLTVGATAGALGTWVYACYLIGHAPEIAASWRDGRDQVALWEAKARIAAAALYLRLLVHLLPPHGEHRREVQA